MTKQKKAAADLMAEVKKWEGIIADLEQRKDGAVRLRIELEDQRKPFTLQAQLGDAEAKSALKKLTAQASEATNDVADLNNAIEQAQAKLRAAQAAVAMEALRVQAREVERLLPVRLEAAAKIDASLQQLAGAISEFKDVGHRIAAISGKRLDHDQERIRVNAAFTGAMYFVGVESLGKFYNPHDAAGGLAALDRGTVQAWRDWVSEILGVNAADAA